MKRILRISTDPKNIKLAIIRYIHVIRVPFQMLKQIKKDTKNGINEKNRHQFPG